MDPYYMDTSPDTLGIAHLQASFSYPIKSVFLAYSSSSFVLQGESSLIGGRFGLMPMLRN